MSTDTTTAIDFAQIQAIQAAGMTQASAGCYRGKLRPFHPGCKRAWSFGPTTASVAKAYQTCDPPILVVSPGTCGTPPETDDTDVATIAEGVAKGLQAAPTIVVRPSPWNDPDYRGIEAPQAGTVVLTTFAATNVQVIEVQQAAAGYLGTGNNPIPAVVATAGGIPAAILSFIPDAAYRAYEFEVGCQDAQVLTYCQWTVTVNGSVKAGPFPLVGGWNKLAVHAKRGDTVAINAILATTDAFAVALTYKLSGFTYPTLTNTDGTYTKSLRQSPSWPRKD